MPSPRWGFLLAAVGCVSPDAVTGDRAERPSATVHSPEMVHPILEVAPPVETHPKPMYGFGHRCRDAHYPALAGPWLVGCGPGGRVDRAEHLGDGREIKLDDAAVSPGAAPGVLFALGGEHGTWRLPAAQPVDPWPVSSNPTRALPATDGRHVALVLDGRIAVFAMGERVQRSREAAPLPWFPPAMSWPWIFWVDGGAQDDSGTDIWAWNVDNGTPAPWVTDAGDQRHVAASGDWVGWLDGSGVHLQQISTRERWFHAADTGFRAGLSLQGSTACWEERKEGDFSVVCTDGAQVLGRDAGWPSRWGSWLVVRIDDVPWVFTAPRTPEHDTANSPSEDSP